MIRIIATLGLFLLFSPPAYGLPADYTETVDAYMKSKETELKASEYTKARAYILGDLNDDGTEDLAVQYTLEGIGGGGNNYSFFLAFFIRTDGGLQLLCVLPVSLP
jgi:hypothetical protein